MTRPPRVGSREWRERFDRDRASFGRRWPWLVALSVLAVVVLLVLALTGRVPVWVLLLL